MTKAPIRRISFFAGPGSGKSTLAAKVFSTLKEKNRPVEHVTEWIKLWAILGIKPESYDQLYILGNQIHEEDARLRKVPVIVTDSPVLLNTAYSSFYGFQHADLLVQMARRFDHDFPALNFFIDRSVPYEQMGRYQDHQKALEFDEFLLNFLDENLGSPLVHVKVDDFRDIIDIIDFHVFQPLEETGDSVPMAIPVEDFPQPPPPSLLVPQERNLWQVTKDAARNAVKMFFLRK